MSHSTAAHGASIVHGTGVTISYGPSGATIKPTSAAPSFGTFLCPIPNPANAPITAKGVQIDATNTLTNVTNVALYSGDSEVAVKSSPVPPKFSIASAVGKDDDGWCLFVTVEFLSPGSNILVKSCAILF